VNNRTWQSAKTHLILGKPVDNIGCIISMHWCSVKVMTGRVYANFLKIEFQRLKIASLCVRQAHFIFVFHSIATDFKYANSSLELPSSANHMPRVCQSKQGISMSCPCTSCTCKSTTVWFELWYFQTQSTHFCLIKYQKHLSGMGAPPMGCSSPSQFGLAQI